MKFTNITYNGVHYSTYKIILRICDTKITTDEPIDHQNEKNKKIINNKLWAICYEQLEQNNEN